MVRGRTLPWTWGNVTYCRRCEPQLYRRTAEIEAENLNRLFRYIRGEPDGMGWLWTGKMNSSGYGLMVPVGGTARHEFLTHRIMFNMLSPFGGHRPTEVIDHRNHIPADVAIFNLEAVSINENRRRRDQPPKGPSLRMWSRRAAELAEMYQLPVPDRFPQAADWLELPPLANASTLRTPILGDPLLMESPANPWAA